MLLFSRISTPQGAPRRAMAFAAEAAGYVNTHTPLDVSVWSGSFGYPTGTVAWSTFVESQAQFDEVTADLMSQDAYHDLLESATDIFPTPATDLLREVIHGEPEGPPPLGAVANITTATAFVDRLADAMTWGVEMAELGTSIIGSPVALLLEAYGQMGAMTWISVSENGAAADDSRAKIRANASYFEKLRDTKELFIPGSGHVARAVRVG